MRATSLGKVLTGQHNSVWQAQASRSLPSKLSSHRTVEMNTGLESSDLFLPVFLRLIFMKQWKCFMLKYLCDHMSCVLSVYTKTVYTVLHHVVRIILIL